MNDIVSKTEEELVSDAGQTVIGTPSGLKAQHAQAELTRRLINSIKHLDETTSHYSRVLIWLTVILGIFALIQILLFVLK